MHHVFCYVLQTIPNSNHEYTKLFCVVQIVIKAEAAIHLNAMYTVAISTKHKQRDAWNLLHPQDASLSSLDGNCVICNKVKLEMTTCIL